MSASPTYCQVAGRDQENRQLEHIDEVWTNSWEQGLFPFICVGCLTPIEDSYHQMGIDCVAVLKEELHICPPCGAGGRWLKALSPSSC